MISTCVFTFRLWSNTFDVFGGIKNILNYTQSPIVSNRILTHLTTEFLLRVLAMSNQQSTVHTR